MSNVKQIALGIMMYAQDYDERISRCGTLTPRSYWSDYVKPYVKNDQIFKCPSRHDAMGYGQNSMIAYWGASPPTVDYPGLGAAIGSVKKPAECILLAESKMQLVGQADHCYSTCAGMDRVTKKPLVTAVNHACICHNDGANYAFFDGHAKWAQWELMLNDPVRWYGTD